METQKSHDLINEGPSLTMKGPPQTNVVHAPMSYLGQNLSMISNYNYTPYPWHLSCSFALLHQLAYFCVVHCKNSMDILTNKNVYLSCTFVLSTLGTEHRYKECARCVGHHPGGIER